MAFAAIADEALLVPSEELLPEPADPLAWNSVRVGSDHRRQHTQNQGWHAVVTGCRRHAEYEKPRPSVRGCGGLGLLFWKASANGISRTQPFRLHC